MALPRPAERFKVLHQNHPKVVWRAGEAARNCFMPPPDKKPLTLRQKILTWVRGKVGQQVGRGECTDPADEALRNSGGKTLYDLGESDQQTGETDHDYAWGNKIDIEDAVPGDILQFKDHEVTTAVDVTVEFPDGTTVEHAAGSDTTTQKRGHHTAVVDEAMRSDGTMRTLEQHVKPLGKKVQKKILQTTDSSATAVTSKRMKNPQTGKVETAKVTTVTTITVTGEINAYRPVEK